MITQERLKELLSYDENTGEFRHLKIRPGVTEDNQLAGCKHRKGYIYISLDGYVYKAHHLAILYVYGIYIDEGEMVDHINHDTSDNRISNLRVVNCTDNMRNLELSPNNTSGFTGVTWHKKNKCWCAQIVVQKKNIYLGSFKNKEDAIAARKEANTKYGFHENHGVRLNNTGGK